LEDDSRGEVATYERGVVTFSRRLKSYQVVDGQKLERVTVTVVPTTEDPSDVTKHISFFLPNEGPPNAKLDKLPWTLRFDVGDRVLVNWRKWRPATVVEVFPIAAKTENGKFVPCYHCEIEGGQFDEKDIFVKEDVTIVKRPDSFRFSLGDTVVFATSLFLGVNNNQLSSPWLEARIIGVDVVHVDGYGVYEINFHGRGRIQRCFIWKDTDEYVASVTRTPRERFLDSIEQDCDYEHFQYLVTAFSLDMVPIRDQVIERSFHFACYGSLLWIFDSGADLEDYAKSKWKRDFNFGVAQSKHAARYFRKLASHVFSRNAPTQRLHERGRLRLKKILRGQTFG